MKIAILGTGSFALSIGYLLEKNHNSITFIGRDETQLTELEKFKMNSKYSLHRFKNKISTLFLETNFNYSSFDILFYCLPSSSISVVKHCPIPIVFTSKGFDTEFIHVQFSNYCILSGGSYSTEILQGIPCYITLTSTNPQLLIKVEQLLKSQFCIISISLFPKDIEIYGIYKNILAIFCGIIFELKMGKNISSAFLTKSLQYINTFYNLEKETILEPAALGDIVLSCHSKKSRNFSFGSNLVKDCNYKSLKLVEGYDSLQRLLKTKPNSLLEDLNNIIYELQQNKNFDTKKSIMSIIYKNN